MTRVRHLVVVGVGLIGGSFARALRAAGLVGQVTGVGRSQANLDVALREGIVDRACVHAPGWAEVVRDADLVLLATPVAQYPAMLAALAPHLDRAAIVTDAGSTKQDVVAAARAALGAAFPRFVPAHPIAGSERSGAAAADPALFAGREVILTPVPETDARASARVAELWQALGAHVTTLSPAQHDRTLAAVSHLPHLLAFAYVEALARRPDVAQTLAHAGAGFRDFTRIAASAPEMWRDIALANRDALAIEIDAFRATLDALAGALAAQDAATLDAHFARAAALRREWAATSADAAPSGEHAIIVGPLSQARGTIALPGSKSITNRALLLAALAHGRTCLRGVLEADDTARMLDALGALGVAVELDVAARTAWVTGCGGRFPVRAADLFLGNAGTAFRPLTAALAMQGGDYALRGVPRMHERPIGDLVDALRMLGCAVRYAGRDGYPPLSIAGTGGRAGSDVALRGDVSSQFLSALLMALPLAHGAATRATTVRLTTPLISRPYVAITTSLMRRFGVDVASPDDDTFVVPASAGYAAPGVLAVEGDASSASYFLAAGVLGGGPVRVTGVGADSIQGDVAFAHVLAGQGARVQFGPDWIEAARGVPLRGGTIDCTAIPDAAMTLAVLALFAARPTRLTGIGSWRVKETDRVAAMATELRKLGAQVDAGDDWLQVAPVAQWRAARLDTYDDHRMAMCAALTAFGGVPVTIVDPACVGKTFPDFFARFAEVAR
jgi:3-phosphoshikimate 1-carboxyvinyltransferase